MSSRPIKNSFQKKNRSRQYIWAGVFVFTLFSFLGLFFAKERILFDSGYRFFFILNVNEFCFSNNRLILFFQQIFIYFLSPLDLNINVLLKIFSISDIPIFLLGFVYSIYKLEKNFTILLLPIGYFYFWGDFFFKLPDMEIHLSAFFLLLQGVLLLNDKPVKTIDIWVYYLCPSIIIFSHPISILPGIYLAYLIQQKHPIKVNFKFLLIPFILLAIRLVIVDPYEKNHAVINGLNPEYIEMLLSTLKEIINSHPSVIILLLLSIYYFRNNYYKLLLFLSFVILYLMAVLLSGKTFNFEAYFMLLGTTLLIISFAFAKEESPKIQKTFTLLLFLFIIPTELYSILKNHTTYMTNVNFVENLCKKTSHLYPIDKFVYGESGLEYDQFSFQYSASLIISSLTSPENSKLFISKEFITYSYKEKTKYLNALDQQKFYSECLNNNELNITRCAFLLFSEPHIDKEIDKQWFMNSLNSNYFNITPSHFSYIDIK